MTYLPSISRKTRAQLIHSHFGHIGWIDMVAVEKSRAKHIVTFYGADISKLPTQDRRWMNRYQELFERSDRFLCEGPNMAGQLIRIGCPTDKVTVHHLGVELEKTPFLPRRWQRGEPLRVLIAGAFREKKGIRYAIEALADLRQNIPLEITIIGDASPEAGSKSEKKRIMRTIDQTGMKPEIRLLGFQPYSVFIEEAYNHHVFISPSVTAEDGDTEGGAPVSIIEMIATGIPVVSTSHCDIPEVLKYGMKDWLVQERDVPGLVERLRWLVEHPGEWPEILVTARRYVEEEFDAVQQGIKLAQIYKKVLS